MTSHKINVLKNTFMALKVMILLCIIVLSTSCFTITSSKFSLDMEVPEGQMARLMAAPVTFADNTRIVDTTGGIASEGGFGWIGAFYQEDATMLGESIKATIDSVQSQTVDVKAPIWRLYTVVRSSMETFTGTTGMRKTVRCVAWCLADAENKVLYHEQFFIFSRTRPFHPMSIGHYKTNTNKIVVRRIIRRALILTTNPDRVDFLENEDPDTYDNFLALKHKEKLPDLEVWKNIKYQGVSYTSGSPHAAYRVSGREPGWEAAKPLDDIDWQSYIANQVSIEGKQ